MEQTRRVGGVSRWRHTRRHHRRFDDGRWRTAAVTSATDVVVAAAAIVVVVVAEDLLLLLRLRLRLLLLLLLLLRTGTGIVQLSRVLLQVEVAAESFSADAASKRLLVVVRVHVERQVVNLMEGLVAYNTLVCLLHAVGQFVVLVVALLVESFTAKLADERLETFN